MPAATRRTKHALRDAGTCPTGLYVDGACDRSAKSGFPVDGRYAYYTYYSFWAVVAALLAFIAFAAPVAGRNGNLPLWAVYLIVSFIIGAAVNSIAVFIGAQVLCFRARFGEHLEDVPDDRITMTMSRYKLRSRAEVLVHSVPAIVSVVLLIGLAFIRAPAGTNRWLLACLALGWVIAGTVAYMLVPVTNRMYGEQKTPDNGKQLRGFEKLDFVYGKRNGIILLLVLLVVTVVGVAVVSHKVLK
jgi:hypothetical protein